MGYFANHYGRLLLPLAENESVGFRPAQLAAIHALGAHFFNNTVPGIVVMPTGTGKSAVLTAAPFVLRASRVLVLTPSRLVREQLAENFRSLVDLRKIGAIPSEVPSPAVGTVSSLVNTNDAWEALRAFDVVVATVPSVSPRPGAVTEPPTDLFDLVLVDEAHHSPARTWALLLKTLAHCRQALLTATPFRLDDKHIGGKIIFRYDMKQARDDGVFGEIRYEAVQRSTSESVDITIARAVERRFVADHDAGLRHLVMVRADSLSRAKELHAVYESHTKLRLEVVKGSHSLKHVKGILRRLETNEADGVVCVNMFGEGFNLPALKIAAVHSPHKSLAVTLQFIGRFARGGHGVGAATFLAEPHESSTELGLLYESGSTWRELVANLGDSRVEEEVTTREMLDSFEIESVPDLADFSLYSLEPYSHVKVYGVRDPVDVKVPPGFPSNLPVIFAGVSNPHGAAVYITRQANTPSWSADDRFIDVSYDIFVFHYNAAHKLLFVCASVRRDTLYDKLVSPLTGGHHRPLSSNSINRVLRGLDGIQVFSLGMKSRNPLGRTESYQQRSGSRVDRSVQQADGRRFDRGHFFATAFDDGTPITIGVSTASRIWQNANLRIPALLNVCDRHANKIADAQPFVTRTGLDNLSTGTDLTSVPGELVFATWSQDTYADPPIVQYADEDGVLTNRSLLDFHLVIVDSRVGNCDFTISASDVTWEGRFEIGQGEMFRRLPTSRRDLYVLVSRSEAVAFADYLTAYPLSFYSADLSRIEGTSLYPQRPALLPFDTDRIECVDWTGIDVQSEKTQTADGRSIFSWVEQRAHSLGDQFVFCDDGPGEIADFITASLSEDGARIRFYHCKASSGPTAGARQKDFHELCCQAMRTCPWFDLAKLMRQIAHRRGTSVPGIRVGGEEEIAALKKLGAGVGVIFEVYLVQPGLSRNDVSPQILEILAGIAGHLHHAGANQFGVIAT